MADFRNDIHGAGASRIGLERLPYYILILVAAWTIVIVSAVVWDVYREEKLTLTLATKEARANFNKDQAFRLWAADHGGIYVPPDTATPPNPYLSHIKERDIVTETGRRLTLMNPAYMLKQMMTQYAALYGIKGRITSTAPLNPDNGPDSWEKMALAKLETGVQEVFEVTQIGGDPYLRLMRPMLTGKKCLKCHGHQGYREGDLRGGVGVSLPLTPYLNSQHSEIRKSIFSHLVLWGLGVLVIYTGFLWLRQQSREQERAEKALMESEKRFKALHNASFGGIAIHDAGQILDCNQGLSTVTGYEISQLIGMDCLQLIAPESRETAMDRIRSGWEKPYEVTGLRKDGSLFPLRLEARNMPFEGKNVRVAEFRDLTEEKAAREAHKKLQEQLIQARKMESVGRLAGGVAHDFNNMLSIIIGNTELALEDLGQGSPVVPNLEEVQNAARRSADLTRQLLAFARKQTVDPKVLDVNTEIEEMLKMLKRLMGEGISLTWQPAEKLWAVKIDPTQLDQILANLCINARDAIDEIGTVAIETANRTLDNEMDSEPGSRPDRDEPDNGHTPKYPEAGQGDYVVIRVTDDGKGMDQETLANLFEPFFTTKEIGQGSGLGLATVYGIVKQNQGTVFVSSTPGQGTAFEILLPRHTSECQTNEAGEKESSDLSGTETILLVEDEPSILEMASLMLRKLGYDVLSAASPGPALQMVSEGKKDSIDLLVTDVVMPEMNGRQLFETLKQFHPDMKSLFMSGYTADIIADHGVLDSGLSFLNKPFTRQELATRIRAVLDAGLS